MHKLKFFITTGSLLLLLVSATAFRTDDKAAILAQTAVSGQSQSLLPSPDNAQHVAASQQTIDKKLEQSKSVLNVKLAEDSAIRARGGNLVPTDPSKGTGTLSAIQDVLKSYNVKKIDRLFQGDEAKLDQDHAIVSAKSGKKLKNLNTWLRIELRDEKSAELAAALKTLNVIETAYPEPVATVGATENYVPSQRYRNAAPVGVDANYAYASSAAGTRGENVKVLDVEIAWNHNHEDVSKLRLPGGASLTPESCESNTAEFNHGTAVTSIIAGDDNGFGVTGIAPQVTYQPVAACTTSIANAVDVARQNSVPGDVILIELHYYRALSDGTTSYDPAEYYQADYDAIRMATAAGRIVVEIAGNGNANFDDQSRFGAVFGPNGRPDSGAIMVGAGSPPALQDNYPFLCNTNLPARSRLSFSNYGSRVDVQNWGACVMAAGYQGIATVTDVNQQYTGYFNGTSSAGSITTGVVASLSSAYEAKYGIAPTPQYIRDLLKQTGVPQDTTTPGGSSGHIGPQSDLKAALSVIQNDTEPDPAPITSTETFQPSADATIRSEYPNTNYGTASKIDADASPVEHSLLKFTVSGTSGYTVKSAKLRLYVSNESSVGGSLYRTASTSWSETSVNWDTAPVADATPFGSIGEAADGQWVEVDATSIIYGDGTYSIRLTSSATNGVGYNSRNASSNKPELVLTLESGTSQPDTAPPSAPGNLTARPDSSSQITLNWTASSDDRGVAGYRINRGGTTIATNITGTSYVDSGLTASTQYSYTVVAFDAAGNVSASSNLASATTNSTVITPVTLSFTPTHDASIKQAYPTSNYGTATKLEVDSSGEHSLLMFTVSGSNGQLAQNAKLRLYIANSSPVGGDLYLTSTNTWSESTVTWNTAPAISGSKIASIGTVKSGTWVEIDLTSVVKGDGTYSLRISTTNSDGADYNSRQASSNKPQLVVTYQ